MGELKNNIIELYFLHALSFLSFSAYFLLISLPVYPTLIFFIASYNISACNTAKKLMVVAYIGMRLGCSTITEYLHQVSASDDVMKPYFTNWNNTINIDTDSCLYLIYHHTPIDVMSHYPLPFPPYGQHTDYNRGNDKKSVLQPYRGS